MKAPYKALDVANYIVWQAAERKNPVTHLKLQKLLYYVVAKYLQEYNEPLIDEPICKWQYGPVVKSVYHQFKILGSLPITEPSEYIINKVPNNPFSGTWADVNGIVQTLHQDLQLKQVTDTVLQDLLSTKDAFQLVAITHREAAWKNYESDILQGIELIYSDDELRVAEYAE